MRPATVDNAQALATLAHAGQVDKAGRPYIEHPAAVAAALAEHGDLAVMAGWLHDVIEDSDLTLRHLAQAEFPAEVIAAVDSVTRRPGETYFNMVRRAAADPLGRLVKLADNAHNADEARLALLSSGDTERLRRKYTRARAILLPEGGPTV